MVDIRKITEEGVASHLAAAFDLSLDLGAHPEISGEEHESCRKFVRALDAAGFTVEHPYMGYPTAFCATMTTGEGPCVDLLVEYDALPEIGHGCGHNVHGPLSLLAGLALADAKDRFRGTLRVVGTPAEETDGAKTGMTTKGAFDKTSLAMMMHSIGGACQPNMDTLSLSCWDIRFKGRSAHAAIAPWDGKSALTAARKFLDLIDARRELFTPDIRANGVFLEGGIAPNIIPEKTHVRFEYRAATKSRLERMKESVFKCADAAAMALDCTVERERTYADFDDMVRVSALEDEVTSILTALGMKVAPVLPPTGSSDIGNVSYVCPSIQPMISITDDQIPLHTIEFAEATSKQRAKEAMRVGACTLAEIALKFFNDAAFRSAVQEDHKRALAQKMSA